MHERVDIDNALRRPRPAPFPPPPLPPHAHTTVIIECIFHLSSHFIQY